jgi:hypothetical protein
MRLAVHLPHLLLLTRVAMCALLMAITVACGQRSDTPVSPTAGGSSDSDAAADGSTLKASTPSIVSPAGGTQVADPFVLTASKASGKYADFNPSYQFQVRSGSTVVYDSGAVGGVGSGNNVTHSVPSSALAPDTAYTWRVRASFQGAVGSWSSDATFTSPVGAYIRGNEIRDPLTIGRTVGTPFGAVQFVQKGLELVTHESRVTYQLPQTLEAGEFSVMVTGIDEGSPGDKTKVMSMQEGGGDITTNDYRFTVEKRGRLYPTPGAVTFRVINGDAGDEDYINDGFRVGVALSDERWYCWRATWGAGFAAVEVREDSCSGRVIYTSHETTNGHAFRPQPHVIHLGAPVGRAGPQDASIPGAIYKDVWVSSARR